jgi:superfamily II DNA or RNA helicase
MREPKQGGDTARELRPYQEKLLDAVRQAYREGARRPCLVLPCGGGKSIIVAEMARLATQRGNRVLFLVHRRELCDQIRRTFADWGVTMHLCDVMMVQTAVRRVAKLKQPGLIITDENHHCLAASYRHIYDAFPDVPCVGVTATPQRLSGGGLGDVNDRLIEGVSAKWLIEHQYLAPYDYFAPSVADLTGLRASHGEYIAADVAARMNRQAIHGDVIAYWRRYAEGRRTICYCASREHSRAVAAAFRAAGVPAAHIDGDTPDRERARTVEAFRRGDLTVLSNVDIISEGFDVPDCSCAVLLRPTKSLTLFIQQSMRPMRYQSGKRAVILDHVGNYARFGLPDADRVWTLDPKHTKRQDKAPPVRQCREVGFATFEARGRVWGPCCGYQFPQKRAPLWEGKEIREAALMRIEGFTLRYDSPAQCRDYAELRAYAKRKGYRPGWAFYQAKLRGFVS